VAKSEAYTLTTAKGIIFFYIIEWKKEQSTYFVRFQYGAEGSDSLIVFGDELKTFSSLDKMKKEIVDLRNYCKNLGYELWPNTAGNAMMNSFRQTVAS